MKKNILLIVVIALVGIMTFTLNSLRAQTDTSPQAAPPAAQPPPQQIPGPRPGFSPGSRPRLTMSYHQAIMALKRVKVDLEHSKEEYDGHRHTAIEACDKTVRELEAILASIQATEAAKAAQQAPPPAAPPVSPAPQQ